MEKQRDPRRNRLWALQDFSHGRGLEVGPLHQAIVGRDEADVRYVDVHDQAGLRAHYAGDPEVPPEAIPEIDYTLVQPDGRTVSLAEACREGAPFDWVVASHVIEHVPDVIGWLDNLAEIVADDGALVLMVPDRRYCFDVHRPPTTVGQMLEAHELGATRPTTRAVYDYFSATVHNDVRELWAGLPPDYSQRMHTIDQALDKVEEGRAGTYVDCHVWLFTPESFLEQMHELRTIGQSSWIVDSMHPTRYHHIEFMVRLRRIPRGRDTRGEQPGELLATGTLPDWLADQSNGRTRVAMVQTELDAANREVRRLERRLARRAAALAKVRKKLDAQRRQVRQLRARAERAEARAEQGQGSWRARVSAAAGRALPGRGD
ncbi:MAG TPA: methyltransferase domain-containing protein [Nocardioides sp.]|uniref:class I SAM-dependent methyltransferase n=1 Tax=Nocardioides sp. TaxID=35761 RepID=UPI002E34470D|nr:methyltransferase domain-containing protein [Nocardioides sp.]HEX5089871.1 methyltransferase domain-containing protein [Nocardioides sp.]